MTFNNPHFKLPFRFTADDAELVEQDDRAEIIQNIWAVLSYEIGERVDDPDFGIPDQTFRQGGADLDVLLSAVARYEPRASAIFEREPGLIGQLIERIEVRQEDSSG